MTTLAAIQGDGWAVIGADRKASDEDGSFVYMSSPKIFLNGCALIAGSGNVRGLNILEHGWTAPRYQGKTVQQYITKYFIPSIRKTMIESGSDIKEESKSAIFENGLIVAVRGQLFAIAEDYSWDQSTRGIFTDGSGGKYAAAVLATTYPNNTQSPQSAIASIRQAITIAIDLDLYSGGDIDTFVQYE